LTSMVKASLDASEKKYNSILAIKSDEIDRLQKIAMNQPNSHNHWWFAGGVLSGVAMSLGIFYAAVQASK